MRWLSEYPVTTDEIVSCLEEVAQSFDPELIGDMRPLLIKQAIARVRSYRGPLDEAGLVVEADADASTKPSCPEE